MIVSRAGNDAVNVNPPTGTTQHLTDHGSSWLWSAFTLTFLAALLTLGGSFRMKRGTRVFHQLVLVSIPSPSRPSTHCHCLHLPPPPHVHLHFY